MRIPLLCLAFSAAAFAPRADALGITSLAGAGEAVLLPYYTVAGGRSSVFSVTNHGDEPSIARVVIGEGRNGRVALSFNIYLAARDSWHGAIVAPAQPSPLVAPLLLTNDASCTSASIGAAGTALRSDGFIGSRDDGLGDSMLRLYTGQVEVIELGRPTGTAAALVQAGDCAGLRARFADGGPWQADPNADVAAPAGRISAQLQLVDVAAGVAFGIEALVLQGFSAGPRNGPGDTDYQAARIYKPTKKNAQGDFEVAGAVVDGERPADAVSLLLMSSEIEAPFSIEASLGATTELVVAFPTRPAYLDNHPGGEFVGETRPPFRHLDMPEPDCIVEPAAVARTIDRSGHLGNVKPLPLCEQVNLVDIRSQGGVADDEENGPEFVTEGVASGRIRIDFDAVPPHTLTYTIGPVENNANAYGLPAMAVSLTEVRNANAQPGVLASYAITNRVVRLPGGSFMDF